MTRRPEHDASGDGLDESGDKREGEMARGLYEILVTGARNSDESVKARDAGWRYDVFCERCKVAPLYTKAGICLRCRGHDVAAVDSSWTSDAALSA